MISVSVKTLDSQNHVFKVEESISVKQFKQIISPTIGISVDEQRLIFHGKVLKDDKPISDYNIGGNVVHIVKRPHNENITANDEPQSQSTSQTGNSGIVFSPGGGDGGAGRGAIIMHFRSRAIGNRSPGQEGGQNNGRPRQVHVIMGADVLNRSPNLLQQLEGIGLSNIANLGEAGIVTSPSSPSSTSSPPTISSRCAASFGNASPSSSTAEVGSSASNSSLATPSVKREDPVDRIIRVSDEVDIDELLQTPPSMVQAQGPILSPQSTPAGASDSSQEPLNPLESLSLTSLIGNLPSEWETDLLNDVRCQKHMPAQEGFSPAYNSLFPKRH